MFMLLNGSFNDFYRRNFSEDPECKKYLPINPDTSDLYTKCNDGVLYWFDEFFYFVA